jgi:hypothetical protein
VIGKLIAWAVAGVAAFEVGKYVKATYFNDVAMIQGHTYSLALNYTKDPMRPIDQATAQAVLDGHSPGHFNVLSAAMTPGVQSGIRQMALSVQLVAPSEDFPASTFTTGWPVAMGNIALASSQDMGGPAGVA